MRAVNYRGDDVTHTPVEFKASADPAAVEIFLTKRGAVVSGRLLDSAGRGTEAAYVVLISADPVRRRHGTGVVSSVHPKADGAFTLDPVPAGEYVIVAATGEQVMHVSMPRADGETLERLVESGERLVLVDNEARSIDLRLLKE